MYCNAPLKGVLRRLSSLFLLLGAFAFADDVPTLDLDTSNPSTEDYATTYRENDPAVILSNNPSLIDADDTVMETAFILLLNPSDGNAEGLTISNPSAYNVDTNNMSNQAIALLPNTPIATVEAFFANVSYRNQSQTPTEGLRYFQIGFRDPRSIDDDIQDIQYRYVTVDVFAFNDAPTVYVDNGSTTRSFTFDENSAPQLLANNPSINDPDSAELYDAEVALLDVQDGTDEHLVLDNPGAHPILSQTEHLIVLQPNQTQAVVEAFFAAVKYEDLDDTPTPNPQRVIEFRVSGDPAYSGGPTPVGKGYVYVDVLPVDDLPVIDLDGDDPNTLGYTLDYTEGDGDQLISNNLKVIDDSPVMIVGRIQLFSALDPGEGFVVDNPGDFPGAFISPSVILWEPQSPENLEALFSVVKYQNPNENPTAGQRVVQFSIQDERQGDQDGGGVPQLYFGFIDVTPVNDAPVVNLNGGPSDGDNSIAHAYTEGDGFLNLAAVDGAFVDVDSPQLQWVTVELLNPLDGSLETLSGPNEEPNNISITYSNGLLTLTGPADLAEFNLALSGISYQNNSENPDTTPRQIRFIAHDGDLPSAPVDAVVSITGVNDKPIINLNGGGIDDDPGISLSYTENDGNRFIAATDAEVVELDGDNLTVLTAQLTGIQDGASERLEIAPSELAGLAMNWDQGSGTLTLTGPGNAAAFTQALRGITYIHDSEAPTDGVRQVAFNTSDGQLAADEAVAVINIQPVNDAPVLDLDPVAPGSGRAVTWIEDAGAVILADAAMDLTDVDDTNMTGATATILAPQNGADETLSVTNPYGTLSWSYDDQTGVLTLSGDDTIDHYKDVLKTLTFNIDNNNPLGADRTVRVMVNDGEADSNAADVTITLDAQNDAPILTADQPIQPDYTEGDTATSLAWTATIDDPDDTQMASATVTLTNPADGVDEILAVTVSGGNISDNYDSGTGVLTLTGADTTANYKATLESLTYINNSSNPTEGDRTLAIVVNDGDVDSNIANLQMGVISTNNPPTLTIIQTPAPTFTEGDAVTSLNQGVDISDAEESQMAGATATLTTTPDGADEVLGVTVSNPAITVNYTAGVLTLSGTADIADYETTLASMTYVNNADNPTGGARVIQLVVTDGEDPSNTETVGVTVVSVNDAPTPQSETATVDQGGTVTALDGGAPSVLTNDSDPEGDNLTVDIGQTIGPNHGSLTLNTDGTFFYTHDGGSEMTDAFTYTVCDDGSPSECATASVTLTINPVIETTDHLAIEVMDHGNICRPAVLSLSARAASGNVDTQYSGTFTITTAEGRGDWILLDGAGSLVNSGGGNAVYTFDPTDHGEVFVQLADNTLGTLNVNLNDGALTETSGAAGPVDDPDINFIDTSGMPWRLESGQVTLNDTAVVADFTQVTFQQAFDAPPLVFLTPTMEEAEPAALRLRNVTETGFQVIQVKPNSTNPDGTSAAMTVDYVAVDPGVHLLVGTGGATLVEACTHATNTYQDTNNTGASGYDTVALAGFSGTPAVLTQIQSMANEGAAVPVETSSPWMTSFAANLYAGSIDLTLERSADSAGQIDSAELIAYLALDANVRDDFDAAGAVTFEVLTTGATISDLCPNTPFAAPFSGTPLAVASKNSRNGGDGGWIRRCAVDANGIDLRIDEDQAVDAERDHGGLEDASVLAFSRAFHALIPLPPSPNHFAVTQTAPGSVCSPATVTLTAHDDLAHNIDTDYLGFVTLTTDSGTGNWSLKSGAGTLNNRGNGQATYRFDAADAGQVILGLSDVDSGMVNIDVTDGQSIEGASEDDDINFIDLSGQPWHLEAGTTALSATGFAPVSFSEAFGAAPLVFLIDSGEGDPAVLRIRNVTASGFEVVAAEHEKTGTATNTATIPTSVTYVAVDPGVHEFPDGTVLEACARPTAATLLTNDASNSTDAVTFLHPYFGYAPAVLTQIQSLNNETGTLPTGDSTPFISGLGLNVTASGMDIGLERAEVAAGAVIQPELVAYLAVDAGITTAFTDTGSNPVTLQSLITGAVVTDADTPVSFGTTYAAAPLVVASQNTRNGTNGGWFRTRGATTTDVTLFCQEDNWADAELAHAAEDGSVLIFDQAFHALITEAAEPDHFAIEVLNDPNAFRPALVAISARNGADAIDTGYTGTVTVTTSTIGGAWIPLSNAGAITDLGNGNFRYHFEALDAGEIILELSHPAGIVNIDVQDGDATEAPGQDPDLTFTDASGGSWQMEVGTFTVQDSAMGATSVTFQTAFAEAPLVFLLETNAEFGTASAEPASLRLLDITASGFQTARVEPANQDGVTGPTTATFLAVTPGIHQIPGGPTLEARIVSTNRYQAWNDGASTWESVTFQSSFAGAPAVLTSIQTLRNETGTLPGSPSLPWMTVAAANVTASGMDVALERAEVYDGGTLPFPEHIAILAVTDGASGSFLDDGSNAVAFEAFTTADAVTEACVTSVFTGSYAAAPIVIAAQSRRDGANGGWLRLCDLTQTGVGFHVQEDTFTDAEVAHTAEAAGVWVFSTSFHATF